MALLSDLIYAGFRIAGIAHRARRNPNLEYQNEGLEIFNRMVGSWSTIKLNIFQELIASYSITGNQQTNTIGPGGQFNADRPVKIERVNLIITAGPPATRRSVNLLTPEDWAAKRVQNVNGPPLDVYDDYASPVSTLYWWPIPDKTYTVELFTWNQIPAATALTNQIHLPPGYEEAITYNLARRFATQFPAEANMTAEALKIARSALDAIQSRNTRSPRMTSDAARLGGSHGPRGDFNWLTGTPL